jgi:hypothetical protein
MTGRQLDQGGTFMSSTISYEIEQYKVLLCSRHGAWMSSYRYQAVITLYQANTAVAWLKFMEGVGNNQDHYFVGRNGQEQLTVLFETTDFDRVLALLQNEKPLYVHLRKTYQTSGALHLGLGSISSDAEPVGEEES